MRCANDQGQQLPITSGTGHKPATLVALLNVQVFRVTEANFVYERLGHPMALPDVREIALIPDQARHDDVGHTAIVNHSLGKSRGQEAAMERNYPGGIVMEHHHPRR